MAVGRQNGAGGATRPGDEARAVTVLVVDDDPAVVRLLRMVFESRGCDVIGAENGVEAVAAYNTCGGADLIVSDLDMPEMDGYAVCRWVESNACDTQVIVVSGTDVDPEDVFNVASSVCGFLRKPIRVNELLNIAFAAIG